MIDVVADRYRVKHFAGAGGCCDAYVCYDVNLERNVLIKHVHDSALDARMQDEIHALQNIRSKFVVDVYDIVVMDGNSYLVQEYLEGESLASLTGCVESKEDFVKNMFQVFSGIFEVHSCGYIHRDIKPDNMRFCSEGYLKIYDFNLSRKLDKAVTRGFRGTELFAAPELYASGDVHFAEAVDIYSGAVCALSLLKGVGMGGLAGALKRKHEGGENPFLAGAEYLPVSICEVLNLALSLESGKRPHSGEVLDVLRGEMLFDRHRALIAWNGTHTVLNSENRRAKISSAKSSMRIVYDGHSFVAQDVVGEIYMNRFKVIDGSRLPNSCVIDLGGYVYMTFDMSNPEVVF